MSNDLKKLYSEVIKSHNDAPYHFEKRPQDASVLKAYNPICGDRFELYINTDQDNIHQLYFHGYGCAVSKASTSVLVKTLEGKTLSAAHSICDDFLRFLDKKELSENQSLNDLFQAFSGVHEFPDRYDCAALSWKLMKDYLLSKKAGHKN